jgi:hypothetical protein
VALIVIAGITPALLMAPSLVVAIAVIFVALCLTINYRRATATDQHTGS